jgi:hypothetical protein
VSNYAIEQVTNAIGRLRCYAINIEVMIFGGAIGPGFGRDVHERGRHDVLDVISADKEVVSQLFAYFGGGHEQSRVLGI